MRFHFPLIIDHKEMQYHPSKKNHSFYNGEDEPKISLPKSRYDIIENHGFWILDTKAQIAYMKSLDPTDIPAHLKKRALQGCKEGKCDL